MTTLSSQTMRLLWVRLILSASLCWLAGPLAGQTYFPPPDSEGGWRTATTAEEVRRLAGLDVQKLDDVFAEFSASTKNGGLLVVRHGWLAYEKYFGHGCREATPNLGSCGKSFTSIAVGILMAEHPDLFGDGLNQKVFTPAYLPAEAFPLSDPAQADIKLGQLLAFSAGIRGNNPGNLRGRRVTLDPPGPDGWQAMVDVVAAGQRDIIVEGGNTSTATLWCKPGEGYSYATASAHLASMIVRHVSGMELEPFLRARLAEPVGWGPFTHAYKSAKEVTHTPGGGGIAVRATDVLRFCYLLLHEGCWQDRQLVPAEYVRHCGRQSPYNPHTPYSLQFDVNTDGHVAGVPRDAFWKTGSGGHVLYVVPSLDLVVWKLAGRDNQYRQSNTGVPMPEASVAGGELRRNWKPTAQLGSMELLQKVVEAVVVPAWRGRPALVSAEGVPPSDRGQDARDTQGQGVPNASVRVGEPHDALATAAPLPAGTVAIGKGGVDGFIAAARDGTLHVVVGGKYRQGPRPDRLGPEEAITDLEPVNMVRIAVDAKGQPHVVFSTGQSSRATRSYYTARIDRRWLPAEKFADATEIPERSRAYVADVAADGEGNVLAGYWINRPSGRRYERELPAFHYRWRSPDGGWGPARSLPSHWSSTPKVEYESGRGFYLLWQSHGADWRIAGPVAAGGQFVEAQSFSTGSDRLTGVSTIQNEGADFSLTPDGGILAASNVREAFEGPVGVWAAVGRDRATLSATFLGSFAGTKRGDESGVHPVVAFDAATGASFVTVMNPADKRACFVVHEPDSGWRRSYVPLLPEHPVPQGTLRQGPSVADLAGPGVVALVRDGEGHWYLRVLDPGEK